MKRLQKPISFPADIKTAEDGTELNEYSGI